MRIVIAVTLTLTLLCTGCKTAPKTAQVSASLNAYRAGSQLPQAVHRVAVLPLTATGEIGADQGRDTLQPVLYSEIAKTAAFETVVISPEQLRALTGRAYWNAQDVLPADFLARLRAATHCDAVLFCRLTQFRPYPPMAIGWDLKLVEVSNRTLLWAVDQVLDSGEPAVARSAREYYVQAISVPSPKGDPSSMLLSPSLFGQYAAATVVGTIPTH
jgi:hypothetical protein